MESIKNAIKMLKPGILLASIDIKDAFYSVLIFPWHRKYLWFTWKGEIYQVLAMPNGYINAMQIFNNLLKLVFASLHEHLKRMPECPECFDNLLSTIF